ncbi:MAG: FkbM family methyltransferase [Chloroflexi bacterium]|nr:FkbM family methyltransferase [Chloroflexota bacterium]
MIAIKSVVLDEFLEPGIVPRLLFMDAEGSEVRILRGARSFISKHKPVLVLDAIPKVLERDGFGVQDLFLEIAELDYVPFGISKLSLIELGSEFDRGYSNWVCLHKTVLSLVPEINKKILQCGLLPCIVGINPMTRREDSRPGIYSSGCEKLQ